MEQVRVIFGPETLITPGIPGDRRGWRAAQGGGQRPQGRRPGREGTRGGAGDFWQGEAELWEKVSGWEGGGVTLQRRT